MIDTRLGGRYHLVRQIGQGGMGRVYEGRHVATGRRIAVKVITAADAAAFGRLEVEARAAGAIESQHIAQVLDVGIDEATGAAYIVMELLEGEDLSLVLCRLGCLPLQLCLRIAVQTCRGLARAHAAGVVHRDIKPANLFLAERDGGELAVKILDFGIAKLRPSPFAQQDAVTLTRTGSMLGTPLYMSPEQVRGQQTLDLRTDLWSLGVVLYEALTGKPPHQRDAVGEVVVAICTAKPPPVDKVAPWVPPGVAAVVARALEIDPKDRFQRAEEMLAALLALLPDDPSIRRSMLVPAEGSVPMSQAHPAAPTVFVASHATGDLPGGTEGATVEVRPPPFPTRTSQRDDLPSPLTSFIGREAEIVEAKRLLQAGRLVSLVGPGGTGKTRLSIQVASELRSSFEDGAVFVDLSSVLEADAILGAIAAGVGVREEPGQALSATMLRQLRPRRLLLVLDNCEHLVGACAELVEEMLLGCPGLRLLVTSRESLALEGEMILALAPLPIPEADHDLGDVARSEAVQLFVERGRSAQAGFRLTAEVAPAVAHICRTLDGIPLAIELAAARLRGLTAEQIAARIEDRFGLLDSIRRTASRRQRTLRALIDWSHELLTDRERAALRRLSVFQGGWVPSAAEAVCTFEGDPLELQPAQVTDLVAQLVGKSLVVAVDRSGSGRYRLLDTIRQYALEKLEESGEAPAVRARHFACYLRLAEEAESKLRTAEQLELLRRLDVEHDNLRAALDGFVEGGAPAGGGDAPRGWLEPEAALRLATALGRYWFLRGHHAEGSARLERLVRQATAAPAAIRGRALSMLLVLLPGSRPGKVTPEEALAACRAGGEGFWISLALLGMAEQALLKGDHATALSALEEGAVHARATGDAWIIARLLGERGRVHRSRLEFEQAVTPLREGLALARQTGDRWLIGILLHALGLTWCFQGEYEAAAALLEESLSLQRVLGSRVSIAETLSTLGGAFQYLGRHGQAATCFEETLSLARALGNEELAARAWLNLADNALVQGDLASARVSLREGFARWQEIVRKELLAWGLLGLAELAWREGRPADAMRFFGAELALEQAYAIGLHPASRARFERILDGLRTSLSEEGERVLELGRALRLEESLREAIAYLTA
ncbi:protein kinase domain-containing protein [Chondromyces crocatus]|uniref:protein kinase domain-containing protein n=1 Tax=Chondromyces crocatus TaxID=52 RepID=UPI00067D3E0C|nr:protein kinase [Chondromyces crocatus]